ncbi:hypothetical protein [Plantibacter sp. ME-Dv--P-095]|uniref:ApeA N-terminal domain 1-containing protein n=1 Tax=Plantibacter sp. ME-Dv--P-095 TaxID=3040299 RepID=UPI00254C82E3|nr:hypothetical protein [Plantibacter sp. ME-Dv--P-095]
MDKSMRPDDRRVGIFLHSSDDNEPFAVGTLWLDPDRGVTAEIPFFPNIQPQFTTPARWFADGPPENIHFRSEHLQVGMFGCTRSRVSSPMHIDVGGLRVRETVLTERTGPVEDPLTVSTFSSRIDGLTEWTRLSSVSWSGEQVADERGSRRRRVTYVIEQAQGLSWAQGEARMSLNTTWRPKENAPRNGVHMEDDVVLRSKFSSPRPIADHLAEHRKFRDLLQFSYGIPASFRGHQVRDSRFPTLSAVGDVVAVESQDVFCSITVPEHFREPLGSNALSFPIVRIDDVTADTLTLWAHKYDALKRVIYPTSGVLRRSGLFAEDKVLNGAMSVEALGRLLPPAPGEAATFSKHSKRKTTATDFYRAMDYLGVDVSAIAGHRSHLAWAMANTYNRVKHADRGDFPEGVHSHVSGMLTLVLVRLALLKLLLPMSPAIQSFVDGWGFGQVVESIRQRGVRADALGEFVTES